MDSSVKLLFSRRRDLFIAAALLAGVWLWYLWVFSVPFFSDQLRLLTANQSPDSSSLKYWVHILTRPAHGPQYRPLSYFALYYWCREIFGLNLWFYHALALGFFSTSVLLCWRWLRLLSRSETAAFLAILFFAVHPTHNVFVSDLAAAEKYYVTLSILLWGLIQTASPHPLRLSGALALGALLSVAIVSHEGSFVFPLIFLMQAAALGRPLSRNWGFLLLPSVAYAVFRFLHWGLPQEGFMETRLSFIPYGLAYYLEFLAKAPFVLMNDFDGRFFWAGAAAAGLWAFWAAWEWRQGKERITAFALAAALVLLVPFAALRNHVIGDRGVWAAPMLALASALWCRRFFEKNSAIRGVRMVGQLGTVGLLVLIIGNCRIQSLKKAGYLESMHVYQKRLAQHIERSLQSWPLAAAIEVRLQTAGGPTASEQSIYKRDILLPAFLALRFPGRIFLLDSSQGKKIFVRDGTFFIKTKIERIWIDPFMYPQALSPPEPTGRIRISQEDLSVLY
ncbi:MAG: hypothetical protein HY401_07545 [Elusimicrobia bacterium]|nr:hypothetical protein [Elusimicrobiota bacterium]